MKKILNDTSTGFVFSHLRGQSSFLPETTSNIRNKYPLMPAIGFLMASLDLTDLDQSSWQKGLASYTGSLNIVATAKIAFHIQTLSW